MSINQYKYNKFVLNIDNQLFFYYICIEMTFLCGNLFMHCDWL